MTSSELTLSEAQREFTRDMADLIEWAYDHDYELTFGDAYRDPRSHGHMGERGSYGRAWSAHKQRLAVDFNLFIDGEYRDDTKSHEPLGEFWESIRPENVWGGRFSKRGKGADGNHYSRRYNSIA